MLKKIKSLFKRKDKSDLWRYLSKDDKDALIEDMFNRLSDLEEENEIIKRELGELPTYCDKCDVNRQHNCMKCSGTGIVKKNRLISWPFQ